jgi:hypothetical protein
MFLLEDAAVGNPYLGFFDEPRRDSMINTVRPNAEQLRNIFEQ